MQTSIIRSFIVFALFFFVCSPTISAQETNYNSTFYKQLKSDIERCNSKLPLEVGEGKAWFSSMTLSENLITMTIHMSKEYSKIMTKEQWEAYYNSNILDIFSNSLQVFNIDITELVDNNILLVVRFLIKEDNSVIYEKTFSKQEMLDAATSKKQIDNAMLPLSVYENMIGQYNLGLPRKIDEKMTLNRVYLEGTNVIYEILTEDDSYKLWETAMKNTDLYNKLKQELARETRNQYATLSKEILDDMHAHGIKFSYKYCMQSDTTQCFMITIDSKTDF